MRIIRVSAQKPAPFVKCVGGKGKLVGALRELLPANYRELRHVEPFVGGGAMLFALRPESALIADRNVDLITAYRMVRDNLLEVIQELGKLVRERDGTEPFTSQERHYYAVRNRFNHGRETRHLEQLQARRTAQFIYLNKTCFNGVFRVNRNGDFNVPEGSYPNPRILDIGTLRAASLALRGVALVPLPFEATLESVGLGDFVYLDPPYEPVVKGGFTTYQEGGFSWDDQLWLAKVIDELDRRGAKVMLSNSDHGHLHELYKHYRIDTVMAARAVNSDVTGRSKVKEIVVRNYA